MLYRCLPSTYEADHLAAPGRELAGGLHLALELSYVNSATLDHGRLGARGLLRGLSCVVDPETGKATVHIHTAWRVEA